MKQRVQYHYRKKGKKSAMTDDRIAKLEAIGFAWVAPGFSQKTSKRKRVEDAADTGGEEIKDTQLDDDLGQDIAANDDDDEQEDTTEPGHFAAAPFFHAPPTFL